MTKLRVLVGCEFSQIVCKAFRDKGHEAYSCDILPTEGNPDWHIQDDVLKHLDDGWDLMIAHPPCTYLTVTGNRWFNVEKYGVKAIQRHKCREEAIKFFMMFANADCPRIAIENPVGIMSNKWRKPDCIIQPYQFGNPFEKKTCLWLKGLPILTPTNIVKPEIRIKYKSGKTMPAWYADAWKMNKNERTKIRSKTFQGIAEAMANQWG
jgi:hypothetical protein